MEKLTEYLIVIGVTIGIVLLMTLPLMWLWNWLMPMIFGLMKLTFWQSLGIVGLCEILFKSHNTK